MRTKKGITIEVHPDIRIPRTFKRFSGLIASLLTSGKIQAAGGGATLLKASKLPISAFLSVGGNLRDNYSLVRVSKKGTLVADLTDFTKQQLDEKKKIAFII